MSGREHVKLWRAYLKWICQSVIRSMNKIARWKKCVSKSENVYCNDCMHITWLNAPQWCARQQKKKKKKKKGFCIEHYHGNTGFHNSECVHWYRVECVHGLHALLQWAKIHIKGALAGLDFKNVCWVQGGQNVFQNVRTSLVGYLLSIST